MSPHLRRSFRLPGRGRGVRLRGLVHNVIVVQPPDPCFCEALFILRDDYLLRPDRDRDSLLREAREAALQFTETAAPRPPRRFPWLLLPLLLIMTLAALRLTGLL